MFQPSSARAVLEVKDGSVWRPICKGNCTTQAFVGAEYRVSGEGVATSKTFGVQPSPYPMMVRAKVAAASAQGLGVVMTTVGAIALVAGSLVVVNNRDTNSDSTAQGGAVAILLGGGLLAGGIVMIATARTRVDFGPPPYGASSPRLVLGKGMELTAEGIKF